MYKFAHMALHSLPPETAHELALGTLKRTQRTPLRAAYSQTLPHKPVTVAGISFPNPVGLAAGLDKNGECVDAFAAMGFGFVEIGTVTPKPQPGNPKPRLFRIPEKGALINRLGFNNKGIDYLLENVERIVSSETVLGINIGKNKSTPEERSLDDYLYGMRRAYMFATYITINISSPNTPGLRELQYGAALRELLRGLKEAHQQLVQAHERYVPLFIKIAPDLTDEEIKAIADTVVESGMDGIIATNTTLSRDAVKGLENADEAGGLSGSVLTDKSLRVTKILAEHLQGALPIIGVGGIDSPAAAKERLAAGASLVQVYSAFIYQGPKLITNIINAI